MRVQTLAQILGGFAVLVGLYFAWKNITTTAKNLELTKEGQVTDRFTKAIEQLGATDNGKPKWELRLGGIYALERIAHDSERDHSPIMEILSAYVRENAPVKDAKGTSSSDEKDDAIAVGIQAILRVLRRREWRYEKAGQHLDLQDTYLRGENLAHANLAHANLAHANLAHANLAHANLAHANLAHANLEFAHLERANLTGASLMCANLTYAGLMRANLRDANLAEADMTRVQLYGAGLIETNLFIANLTDADLRKANLTGADLTNANLTGADLSDSLGVTQEQLDSALGDATTKLPASIVMPSPGRRRPQVDITSNRRWGEELTAAREGQSAGLTSCTAITNDCA
jgi:uncharacterized protein YjbI with pentapeptide repeats